MEYRGNAMDLLLESDVVIVRAMAQNHLYGGVGLYHAPAFYSQWITFLTRLDLR